MLIKSQSPQEYSVFVLEPLVRDCLETILGPRHFINDDAGADEDCLR
jgi:hypothetical protein